MKETVNRCEEYNSLYMTNYFIMTENIFILDCFKYSCKRCWNNAIYLKARNKLRYKLKDALMDIEMHTNIETKFDVYVSESLNCLKKSLHDCNNIELIKRILSKKRKYKIL
jgi:hypothetical protein